MIHGYQKKIYHVKSVGGKYFDEAYLVLRDGVGDGGRECSKDLAAEADRIIREASASVRFRRAKNGGLKNALIFALGAASSSAVIGAVALISSL